MERLGRVIFDGLEQGFDRGGSLFRAHIYSGTAGGLLYRSFLWLTRWTFFFPFFFTVSCSSTISPS